MNKKIIDMINTTAGRLIFALISGLGYFMILSEWILGMSRGMWLILMYVAPVLICGAAIVIVKLIKQAQESEDNGKIIRIFWIHAAVVFVGAVFTVSMFTV